METTFANPFQLADLLIFEQAHLCQILGGCIQKMTLERFAWGLHDAPAALIERAGACLPAAQRRMFYRALRHPLPRSEIEQARQELLDLLFWEVTYWKTPELYEELTAGERLHPGIFPRLEPLLRDKVVLDAGAGSGRASFECLRYGANLVYAFEPSPGLLRLLRQKLVESPVRQRILPGAGDFAHIPLGDRSVDLALACSAFTAEPEQGGEPGLAELRRVVRPGGAIVLIWPRPEDRSWLAERGFHYVALPCEQEMTVRFPSFTAALRCAHRFYARNPKVLRYLQRRRQPVVPFSVIGSHPPCDYCWLRVR
ncbi:MAG TPA: class I SAM-dependent methyltransferase [Ktedonobacteraceae bacterium]|nr:class I SAM-dependent methyltransferase [Ktedonobacteraceae bacterium]